jgi:phosphopantothenoylcysteine decarboxylase/phosphopantothenate--cysteine ligase
MGHIELSRSADLVGGGAGDGGPDGQGGERAGGDLASTTLLATDKPVLMAPAMNVRMWEHAGHPAESGDAQGRRRVVRRADEGAMACGEYGPGRMAEPPAIFEAIMGLLASGPAAGGRRAVITAGPTAEPIDPVRLITNRSSGKQGYAIAWPWRRSAPR